MCGIVGTIYFDGPEAIDERSLRRMLGAVRHRGPDQFGVYLYRDDLSAAGLGNARLSIVDLAGGQQPIGNEDSTLWIVFNGEVFNHPELRRELRLRGHQFTTESDTEVVLHLFEERGPACRDRLNGQFAFAIWDEQQRELFLARDRLGILPLFY
jgi:asparagine synthase (glutamine-hydrolysing)